MRALAICNHGFEDETIAEIKEINKKILNFEKYDGFIVFDVSSNEDIAQIAYLSQTINKIFLVISESEDYEIVSDEISKKEYKIFLEKDFKVFYKIIPSTEDLNTNSPEDNDDKKEHINEIIKIANSITQKVKEKLSIEMKASMNAYKTGIYFLKSHSSNKSYLTIDFSGKDLFKRDYRIFCHKNSLNATIASSLYYFSEMNELIKKRTTKDKIILDPFCGSGTIPIEFAIKFNRISPQRFEEDKLAYKNFGITIKTEEDFDNEEISKIKIIGYDSMLPSVKAAQKNAKIANINDFLEFSKVATDWLDIKFEEKSVDAIITDPPIISKDCDEKEVSKSYKELFYQADYILKNDGKIVIICQNDKIKSFATKFNLVKEKTAYQGKQKMLVMMFARK